MSELLLPDGSRMHYEVHEGLAPVDVLFLHGNLASSRWWHPLLGEWRKSLPAGKPVGSLIFSDWRGCGKSSDPRAPQEMLMKTLAGDQLRLLDHLGVAQADVVGHSTGGAIALSLMCLAPERVRKAALLDSVGAAGIRFGEDMKAAFRAMASDRALTATVIGSTIRGVDPQSAFFREVVAEDACRAVRSLGTWVLESLEGLDLTEPLRSLRQQVLVLHGEHDGLLPKDDSRKLASLLPGGRFLELAGCGHCGNVEDPAELVRVLKGFLG
ncbi:MAG: alpha/beta hydrolase [Elusimicrobiota bacterium]|jgi:pimeloyl-ACP methyl ester carboxylesterase